MVEVEMRKDCLTELKLDVAVDYKEGEYPSPSILSTGKTLCVRQHPQVASYRLDVPTRQRLLAALNGPSLVAKYSLVTITFASGALAHRPGI